VYEAPVRVPDSMKERDAKDTQRAVRDEAEYIPAVKFSGLV
jgi:hypothetical protein